VGEAIGQVLGLAVGVALSPVPIVAVILMLFSARAKANGPAFLAGWIVGLSVVCAIVVSIASGADVEDSSEPSTGASWVKLVLGILLLLAGLHEWRGRPRAGEEPKMPKWMAAIDAFTVPKSFGIGVLLSGLNPKNLLLAVAAATTVAQLGLSTGETVGALAVFVAIGSVTIAAPVLLYLVGGEGTRSKLDELKAWLAQNNAAVMAVILVVLGFDLLGKGIAGLAS
jgi:threonine/homoserine/homoserine lactone efflux protein